MNECDIYVAEEILKRLKNRNGCVTGVDIEELVTDEAQYYRIDINWLLTGEGSILKNTDQPVSQGGEDATLSEADLNNSNTMKKYLDQVLRQNEELIRQNGVLLDLFREERAKNKGEVALKKEG